VEVHLVVSSPALARTLSAYELPDCEFPGAFEATRAPGSHSTEEPSLVERAWAVLEEHYEDDHGALRILAHLPDKNWSDIPFATADDEFSDVSSVIYVRLEIRCEHCFDDLGASRSEISTLIHQFFEFVNELLGKSHTKFFRGPLLKPSENSVERVHGYLNGLSLLLQIPYRRVTVYQDERPNF